MHYHINQDSNILESSPSFLLELGSAITASMMLHPLHFAESRFILNNRLPNFGAYKSLYTLILTNRNLTEVARGASVHLPVSLIMAFSGFNFSRSVNELSYLMN